LTEGYVADPCATLPHPSDVHTSTTHLAFLQPSQHHLRSLVVVSGPASKNFSSGEEVRNQSASATSAPPNPDQGRQPRAPDPSQPVYYRYPPLPACDAGHASEAPPRETGTHRGSRPANPDREQPPGGAGPKFPGRGSSVGASPGRRRAGRVWACAVCARTAEMLSSGKLMECTRCRSVRYCGKDCQKADWPAHKPTCKRLQAERG
jgi:hypothetical protein